MFALRIELLSSTDEFNIALPPLGFFKQRRNFDIVPLLEGGLS